MRTTIKISGMSCAACSASLEKTLQKLSGISKAHVSIATCDATIEYDPEKISLDDIYNNIYKAGYTAHTNHETLESLETFYNQSNNSARCSTCHRVIKSFSLSECLSCRV
jgi:copper chaperone CopZ